MLIALLALVVLIVASVFLLVRRSGAPEHPASAGFSHGDPYPADTYGTNPHGLSLGLPRSDDPPA